MSDLIGGRDPAPPVRVDLFGAVEPGDETPLGPLVEVNRDPVQRPNRHRLVHEELIGGPRSHRDQRLILDRRWLSQMSELAEASISGRVLLHQVGIRARMWQAPDGHVFATWSIVYGKAEPEMRSVVGVSLGGRAR